MGRDFNYYARRFPFFFGAPSPERQAKDNRRRRRSAIAVLSLLLASAIAVFVYSASPAGRRAQLEAGLQRIDQREQHIAADRVRRAADRAAVAVHRNANSAVAEETKQVLSEVDHLATESERQLRGAEDEVLRNGRSRRAQILEELRAPGPGVRKLKQGAL